jgi:hypothetical protein
MKARNCCKTMQAELTAWKANVYDIARRMDRIEQIQEKCTPETGIDDIRTDREEFDKHLATLRVTADEAMKGLGGGNFGG